MYKLYHLEFRLHVCRAGGSEGEYTRQPYGVRAVNLA